MVVKGSIKQRLLKFGGYNLARKLHARYEHAGLERRIRAFLETGELPLPDMVMFEPTLRCNLRCKMCYQDRGAMGQLRELTLEQIIEFFDRTPYLRKVTLIGGEVFLRTDMLDVIRSLESSRNLIICTNGTLIGEAEVKGLKSCRHIFSMDISLDGPQPVHDSIRRVRGSYERVTRTIRALVPMFPVTVNCVVQNENVGSLTDVVDICSSLGVKQLKFEIERIYPRETIAETHEAGLVMDDVPLPLRDRTRRYSLETLRSRLRECRERGKRAGMYITFSPPYLMEELENCYAGRLRSLRSYACETFRTATIAPDGTVISCYTLRVPFGHILDTPLEEVWNSEAARAYQKRLIHENMTPLCENCPFMTPYG